MFDALLTWQTALVISGVYCTVTVIKTVLGLTAPTLRHQPWVKKLALPVLATGLGVLLAQLVHPPVVTSDSEINLYGAVIGYCSSALWRHLVGIVPALKSVDSRLSGRPRMTIPAAPGYPSDSLRVEEENLP
jgi:hypothetical protein